MGVSFTRRRGFATFSLYVLLAGLVVAGWAWLGRPANAATPPDLRHLAFSPSSVDITSADAPVTVHLTVQASAGFASGCISLNKPNSSVEYTGVCFDGDQRVSGTATSGMYDVTLVMRHYAHTGFYAVGGITLVDVNGARVTYRAGDLAAEGFPYGVTVTGTSDNTAPTLVSLDFSADSGDLAAGPFTSIVTAHVTDSQSGYAGFCIDFGSPQFPNSAGGASACLFPAQRISGTAQDGVYQATLTIPQNASPGRYPILQYHLQDDAQNFVNLNASQLESFGAPAALIMSNSNDTVPSPPRSVTATAGDTAATVSWLAPTSNGGAPVLGYTVTSSHGAQTATVNGTTNTAVVNGLTNGTPYTFTVHATNGVGSSVESTPSNQVVPESTPTAPTNVVTTAGAAQATVTWTPPLSDGGSPITGYRITQADNWCGPNGPACATTTAASDATSATLTGLKNGRPYSFTVRAFNAIGNGPLSAPSDPDTTDPGVATAPPFVTATAGNARAFLQWGVPANDGGSPIVSYRVTASPGGQSMTVPVKPGTQSGTLTGLSNGVSYTFTAVATNAYGDSPASAPSAAVKTYGPADAPTNVHATAGVGSATITWTAPFDEGSPIYDYVVTASPGGKKADAAPPATKVTMNGLTPGTTYTFTVAGNNGAGAGTESAPSNKVTIPAPPARPAAPHVQSGPAPGATGSLRVTYTAPANHGSAITKYTAKCTPANGGASKTATHAGATAAPITISGLPTKTAYRCTISATNARGTSPASAASAPIPVGSPAAAATPAVTRSGPGALRVTFTAPANNGAPITSYTATCTSTNGGVARSKSGTTTTITVAGLTAGKTYHCTVVAKNSRGTGAASSASNPTTA